MMKRLIFSLVAVVAGMAMVCAQLAFSDDGKFKIVQFTDVHYKWSNPKSQPAIENIASVLDAEQPDLVIFTGDQVYADSVQNALAEIIACVNERNVPFAMIFGNHDHQFDMSLDDQYDFIQQQPGCVMPKREQPGAYDFALTIRGANARSNAFALYGLYTHSKNSIVPGYDCLMPSQIDWYQAKSDELAAAAGQQLPALMFIHIPLPEYNDALKAGKISGNKKEKICSSALNSGMFMALREKGDVSAVFCGHDHDNDFLAEYLGVLLGYGRYTGGNTVYNHVSRGARVIVLDQQNPRTINTWVRLSDGSVIDEITWTQPTE